MVDPVETVVRERGELLDRLQKALEHHSVDTQLYLATAFMDLETLERTVKFNEERMPK